MLSDLRATELVLLNARCPEDVFGRLVPSDLPTLKRAYHHIARVIHPDHYAGHPEASKLAQDLFGKLTEWRARAEVKVRAKTYGDNKPHKSEPPKPTTAVQVIQTPKRKYIVTDLFAEGDLADLYRCSYTEDGKEHHALFKIAQSAADNDLLENEQKILGSMYALKQAEVKFYRYLPKPLDSFILRGSGVNRRVNVIQLADGYVSLADVMKAYPAGLDYRDAVWMLKRSLAGLGYVHIHKKVVHGAVLPTHVLVHPTGHGAKIVDWCYAVQNWEEKKDHVKAISKGYKAYYPSEILAKKPPTPQSDLYILAKCFVALLGGDVGTNRMPDSVPKQLRLFLASCLIENQSRRPDDAWKLHEELDELLERLVGKAKYRPLEMPAEI
jgi:hypothetical protein